MAHHQGPWQQEEKDPAEKFLDYVSRAGIAITAVLAAALAVGTLVLVLPTSEAIATLVFSGLLVAVAVGARRVGHFEDPPEF